MKTWTGRIVVMTVGLLGLVGCAGDRPTNLGVKAGLLAQCPSSPNCVSSQASDEHHRIAPLPFSGDPYAAFARLKRIVFSRSDTTTVEDLPDYLRIELRTLLFIDDGEFLLDQTNNVIHVRSASRLGYSDFGKNGSRIEEIRSQFLAPGAK